MGKIKIVIPPKNFTDYEWDDDFKIVMFCLEFTRLYFSHYKINKWAKEELREWGYKDKNEVYDHLWCRFKYFKGHAFDKKFKIVEGHIICPHCKQQIEFAEIKPMTILDIIEEEGG